MPRFPALAVLVAVVVAGCLGTVSEPDQPPTNARELAEECFSAWDGNHDGFERLVKAGLNDPNSMEVHGTYFSELDDLDDGEIRIKMDYSALNAFGGRVRTTAWARMGLDCGVIEVVSYGYE